MTIGSFLARRKIYFAAFIWLVVCLTAFKFIFEKLDVSNQTLVKVLSDKVKELKILENEQESFIQAQKDLEELKKKPYQVEEFFSRDINLVNEIRTLEELAETSGVKLNLTGVSGTVVKAAKANTTGEIYIIPYNLELSGSFSKVVAFVETLEHLDFITPISSLNITASSNNEISAKLAARFYIKK